MQRSSLRPESALTPRLVRREAVQLAVVAALTILALLFGPRALRIVAGVADVGAGLLTAVALLVAWKAVGRGRPLGVYALAFVVFAALAVLNLRG